MSTYNEKDSIRQCIDDFFATGFVDEVIIVDNNAVEGTVDEVKKTKATLIHEAKQGYGHGFQRALSEAKGDLLVMCEPDATFLPADIEKFLAFSGNVDVVQGTRTVTVFIFEYANMGFFLKNGNYLVAKAIQFLFIRRAPHLSDCGCTFRLLSREAYEHVKPFFRCGGSAFGMELSLLCIRSGLRMCQIPIQYGKRVGQSSVTGSFRKTLAVGFTMIGMILYHFVEDLFRPIRAKD